MDEATGGEIRPTRRRSAPLLWVSGALAAALLVLGVNGTLGSWTTAIITNDNNSAGTTTSVVLEETGPDSAGAATTCSTSGSATNVATCSTINKYGANGVKRLDLQPGDSITTTVALKNTGSGPGSAFTMAPGACASVYSAGINAPGVPAAGDSLCTKLLVGVTCTGGATLTMAPTALSTLGTQTFTGGLASGATATCIFTVSLPAATPANFSGQTVTQPIVWTLTV